MDKPELKHDVFPTSRTIELGMNPRAWDSYVDELIEAGVHVIALRGAGKANGIAPESVTAIVDMLSEYLGVITSQDAPIAIMYDGDEDRPQLPDIGHIFGQLADRHNGKQISFVAAQTHDRYTRQAPNGGPLRSATGTPYETFTFSPDLPGGHARLTQSAKLVEAGDYEQIIIGQTGPAVSKQLADLDRKASNRPEGPIRVLVIDAAGDKAIDEDITLQLANPGLDDATRIKLENRIVQRMEHPKGFLFDSQGHLALDQADHPNLTFIITSAHQ